jgi:hypothetical protein
MTEATRRQDGRVAQPRHRPSVRHKQPPRVRTHGCNQQEKAPELPAQPMRSADARRSGQVTRRGQSGAWGNEKSCCDIVTVDGGDCPHPPQQPCSRPHHKTGRFRLPGHQGWKGAWRPGRRRADAREVRGARSFSGLHDISSKIRPIGAKPCEPLLVQIGKRYGATTDMNDPLDDVCVRPVLSCLVALIGASTVQRQQTCCFRHAQPFCQSPAFHIHAPYSANR